MNATVDKVSSKRNHKAEKKKKEKTHGKTNLYGTVFFCYFIFFTTEHILFEDDIVQMEELREGINSKLEF